MKPEKIILLAVVVIVVFRYYVSSKLNGSNPQKGNSGVVPVQGGGSPTP